MDKPYKKHPSAWHLDFTRAEIGKPVLDASTIRVPIERFGVLKGIFDLTNATFFLSGTLVYEHVRQSTRTITEYLDATGTEFSTPYTIVDDAFIASHKAMFLHTLHVVSKDPFAWVSWQIVAADIRLEDRNVGT